MNDLRTAIVGFTCLAVGIVGTWFIFGAKAAQLEKENRALRQQQTGFPREFPDSPADLRQQLIGQWATTVSKTRLGRIELIFELSDDGRVRWKSVQGQQIKTIAEGTWQVEDRNLQFTVIVLDQGNPPENAASAARTATATILELSGACLALEVDGDQWGFHRTSI